MDVSPRRWPLASAKVRLPAVPGNPTVERACARPPLHRVPPSRICGEGMPASEEIQARYGRRAGWVRHHLARTLDRFGAFFPLRRIPWTEVERLVFVCQGNICRSAYADALARRAGLRSVSFGLG